MLQSQIDLSEMTSFIIGFSMAMIGITYFLGFGVKKVMQFLKSF